MSLLHVSGLAFRHPSQSDWLFRDVSFDVNPRDRVGLVGINGCGKTTLLRLISGELPAPANALVCRRGLVIAHAHQVSADQHRTLLDHARSADARVHTLAVEMFRLETALHDDRAGMEYAQLVSEYAELGGYEFEAKVAQVLAGLGFSELERQLPLSRLSGGQRTRAELARVLLTPADVVLLDEPTNHLDVEARNWLERYVAGLDAAVIAVSHDRRFLQSTATRILELRRSQFAVYSGGYDWYREQRRLEQEQEWQRWHAQQRRDRAAQQAADQRMRVARSVGEQPRGARERYGKDFYAAKAAKVQRTAKVITARAAREPAAPKPIIDDPIPQLRFPDLARPSDPVVEITGVSKRYGDKQLFHELTLRVGRGERVAICGANGTGKTTLLRILLGEVQPDTGVASFGTNVRVGYFAQDAADLDLEQSPIDACREASDDTTWAYTLLGGLRVPKPQLHRPLGELSAGERAKVAFARLLLAVPNVLILDEPTNHLDIDTQEVIEEALAEYPGSILLVSHDRMLVERLAATCIDVASSPGPGAPEMSAADAVALYDMLHAAGTPVWLDGGWAVDALLGRQTRRHADLDIVVEERHLERLRSTLDRVGFDVVPRDGDHAWVFVLGDQHGRQVDVHVVVFDEDGNGVYGPPERGVCYPAGCLEGRGTIAGTEVRCLTPDVLVRFHTGYEFDEDDIADVLALCDAFDVPVPQEYETFVDDRTSRRGEGRTGNEGLRA